MSYQQIVKYNENGITPDNISLLTGQPLSYVENVIANNELEERMSGEGFKRYMERQDSMKERGKAMDTDSYMHFIQRHIRSTGKRIAEWMDEHPKTQETKYLKTCDVDALALSALRSILKPNKDNNTLKLTALCSTVAQMMDKPHYTEEENGRCIKAARIAIISLIEQCPEYFILQKVTGENGHGIYAIEHTEEFAAWEKEHTQEIAEMSIMFRPMVIPPKPWTGIRNGGYHNPKLQNAFIRNRRKLPEKLYGTEAIPRLYLAANKVQATPFAINTFVLDTAEALRELGFTHKKFFQDEPEIPHTDSMNDLSDRIGELQESLGITRELWTEDCQEHRFKKDQPTWSVWVRKVMTALTGDKGKRKALLEELQFKRVQLMKWKRKVTSIRSKNRLMNVTLVLGDEYREFDQIYFPHNYCWRARMYPMTAGLTTQGVGLQKAVLKFDKGLALNSKGEANGIKALSYLKIHVANCWGLDKKPMKVRKAWVDDNHDLIQRIAADPVGTVEEWKDADTPWLFIAACEAYNEYLTYGLDACIAIPIPMDGTCNGAQHYAALTRDKKGAYAVNVMPNGTMGMRERLTELRANL